MSLYLQYKDYKFFFVYALIEVYKFAHNLTYLFICLFVNYIALCGKLYLHEDVINLNKIELMLPIVYVGVGVSQLQWQCVVH
jgi:hypothetical protein